MAKMTLKVKKGAIIEVETITGSFYSGKVIDLFPDRIVLMPQFLVAVEDIDSSPSFTEIRCDMSIDAGKDFETTIYRDKIVSWSYDCPASCEDPNPSILRPSEIEEDDIINTYTDNGLCLGEGDYLEQ